MEKVKYPVFQHTVSWGDGEKLMPFYSNEGSYIPVFKYWELRRENKSDQTVWMDYAKKYADSKISQDNWPDISSLKELMRYIYGQLNKANQEKIKMGKKDTKDLKDMIKLFPEVYYGILLLRLDYDNKVGQKDIKKINKVVSTISRVYNADAWIE